MKKRIFAVLMICMVAGFCFSCGSDSSTKSEKAKNEKSTEASADSGSSADSGTAESEDPVNVDPTAETSAANTASQMKKRYIGTWMLKGVLNSDGSIAASGSCKYVFRSDGSYTCSGKTAEGSAIDESGTWKLNGDKKIVAGENAMGIDDNGYLLKYTGSRNGKGMKLYYAFEKDK